MALNCWVCKSSILENDFRMQCVKCEMHMCWNCAANERLQCFNTSACIMSKRSSATEMEEVTSTGKCAVCKSKILENPVVCPMCDVAHCESCWYDNNKRCSVYGCVSVVQVPVIVSPPPTPERSLGYFALVSLVIPLLIVSGLAIGIASFDSSVIGLINIPTDEIVVDELGSRTMVMEPGHSYIYYADGAKLTRYKWRGQINFSVPATLMYGVKADIFGSVGYDLPVNESYMFKFHSDSEAAEGDLISRMIIDTIQFVGPQISNQYDFPRIIKYDVGREASRYGIDLYNWKIDVQLTMTKAELLRDRMSRFHVAPYQSYPRRPYGDNQRGQSCISGSVFDK